MTRIDLTPIEEMIANLREENERLREINRLQVHQIDVAHARIDHLEEQLRKAQQREAMRSGVWYGGRIVRSGE
jgi:chromosome segregation ATPase